MLRQEKITEEQVTTFAADVKATDLEIGNSRFGIGIIMVMACFVGVWGCVCLLNGLIQSHTIHELGRGIVTAFIGI